MDWAFLARYFAGELAMAERAELACWAIREAGRREELAALREVWQLAGALPSPSRVDAMWAALAQQLHSSEKAPANGR